jgi:hypothetical protein
MKMRYLMGLFIICPCFLYSQYNYANGNGTIIEEKEIDGIKWIFRKHEQYSGVYNDECLTVYDKPGLINVKILFKLNMSEQINIYELATEEKNNQIRLWLKIKNNDGNEGWIYGGTRDPYSDGIGEILENINIEDKIWTVMRIHDDSLLVADGLRVRDKPGLVNTNVLFQIRRADYLDVIIERKWGDYYYGMYVDIIAITKEKDTIDNITDYWVMIRDRQARIGWVFGGYLIMGDRGGAKYHTPDIYVSYKLTPP